MMLKNGQHYTRRELSDRGCNAFLINQMVRDGDLFVEMKDGVEKFKKI